MDSLVVKNIIKKDKIIVDIGSKYIKVLEVHYASKKITIKNAHKIDSVSMFQNGIDFSEIARAVSKVIGTKNKCEMSVSLPSELIESKIITVKNKKEIIKTIEKEYTTFTRASHLTHVMDYAYLGKKEDNGDTLKYCLLSAIHKNTAQQLTEAFEQNKLKITTVTFPIYNMICLSSLYFDDYEHLNRLMIDFGATGTRVVAFSDGIPVYSRNIDIGFNTYVEKLFSMQETVGKSDIIKALTNIGEVGLLTNEHMKKYFSELDTSTYFQAVSDVSNKLINEIQRIIELCETNEIGITKIVYGSSVLNGFDKKLKQIGLETEKFNLDMCGEMSGENFLLWIDEIPVGSLFYNSLGLAVNTMLQDKKKLNLLPTWVKSKYANKYMTYISSIICSIFIFALSFQYFNMGLLNYDIQQIQKENAKYNEEKTKMESLQNIINEHKNFLENYQNSQFPFSLFMNDIELNRPQSVSIISVDSKDRLMVSEENAEQKKIEYIKDLKDEQIIIRGYGENSKDISKFIYSISKLNYIKNAEITAIEQHKLSDNLVNIFEITIIGGVFE